QLVDDLPHGDLPLTVEALSIDDHETLRLVLIDLAQRILSSIMQPDYIALMRVLVAEAPHFPQLGALFTATAPARAFRSIAIVLQEAQKRGCITVVDIDAATRLLIGSLLTYAILDGLFVIDGPPRPPESARITAIIDLYIRALT
ncbi:MAG: TetR/AcrR family transcriptional regulator C-terminal domain-containing protein, partial [Chloroflexales bacterium]|nr:TetR/AcrR family transcriptional regulator C-terminal domain-containing protein [Chloroflexales bacterium]